MQLNAGPDTLLHAMTPAPVRPVLGNDKLITNLDGKGCGPASRPQSASASSGRANQNVPPKNSSGQGLRKADQTWYLASYFASSSCWVADEVLLIA